MASTTAICDSYRGELHQAIHDFTTSTGDTFKLSMYTSTATNGAATTAYTATNEIAGTGYTATGGTLVIPASVPTVGSNKSFIDFTDLVFSTASITAASCLIYNDTAAGDPSVQVHDFGGDKTSSAADFTIQFPAFDATNAIQRLA